MAGTKEYLDRFSSVTFEEKPFCDGDAIAFAELSYLPFEREVSPSFDDEPVDFRRISNRLYFSDEHNLSKIGLFISPNLGKRLMVMAEGKRYEGMKICAYRAFYNTEPAVQFAAGTFIMPDGTLIITFEGTNDTLAGWKEDVDFLVHRQSPAYEYALTYINEAAAKFDGQIILIGHSKGAHEALYTALKCSPEIRSRIKYLYNNDGPGFYTHDFFRTGAFDELLQGDRYKHYVPSSSTVGMLMAHDYEYKAVKSTRHIGMLQHDMETWKFDDDGNLSFAPDTDIVCKITDVFMAKLVEKTEQKNLDALDKVLSGLIKGSGQETLTGLAKNAVSAVSGAKKAWDGVEPDVKDAFKGAFSGAGKLLKDSINIAKEKGESIKQDVRKAAALV